MIRFFFKKAYWIITLCATLGGAIAFIQLFTAGEEYGLTTYLKSTEKVIENTGKDSSIRVLFNDEEITSLYLSKIELKNTGRRALTKDFIFTPITISTGASNSILKATSPSPFVTHTANSIVIRWELLNPGDVIDVSVFTKEPIDIKSTQQIKEIQKVEYLDEVANPPSKDRLKSLSVVWFVLSVLALVALIDGILLVKSDKKLERVFSLARSLEATQSVNKNEFLQQLATLYEDYYQSVPLLFVSTDELIKKVSEKCGQTNTISGRDLALVGQAVLTYAGNANMYFTRASGIFVGPLLFGFCFIRIGIALFV